LINKPENLKQIVIAYITSAMLLSGIFVVTMFKHYQKLDNEYLVFGLGRILLISLVPAIIVWVLRLKHAVGVAAVGILVGFALAVVYVGFASNT